MKILVAWELGGNLGHLARCLPIVRRLCERGHEVLVAVRDTRAAAGLPLPAGALLVQAPTLATHLRLAVPPANYAEMLLGEGWGDPPALRGAVMAWRGLLRWGGIDALLADHAPTALLAARLDGVPRLAIGNGFAVPPRVFPMPSIRPWESIPAERLVRAGKRVDAALSGLAAELGGGTASRLGELFSGDDLIDVFPELDPFRDRPAGNYIGTIFALPEAPPAVWQSRGRRRILAYVRPTVAGFVPLLQALRELDAESLCVAPGLDEAVVRRLSDARLRLSASPLSLGAAMATADLAIGHGGSGHISEALLAGVPMLLVPGVVEQYLVCGTVETLGAGIAVGVERDLASFRSALSALLSDTRYADRARDFATRHAGYSPDMAVARAVAAIETRAGG